MENGIQYLKTERYTPKQIVNPSLNLNFEPINPVETISGYQRLYRPESSSQQSSENSEVSISQEKTTKSRNSSQKTKGRSIQETVQAETVSKTTRSNPTTSITISPTSKKSEKGTISLDGIDVGNMKHVLDKLSEAGISVKVTSGRREAGKAGKAGNKSHHISGNAIDVVPGNGETFESIRQKIKNNPKLLQYFRDNKIGIIDETNEETMKRTGATGAHWHIGPDRLALSGFETMFAKQGGNIPSRIDILVAKFNKQFNK